MNTAEKLPVVHECSCGRFYGSPEGVAACQNNRHGSGKDALDGRIRFLTTLETEYSVSCPVCGFYIERGFGQTTVEEELKGQERFKEYGRRAAGRLKRDDKGRFTEVAA